MMCKAKITESQNCALKFFMPHPTSNVRATVWRVCMSSGHVSCQRHSSKYQITLSGRLTPRDPHKPLLSGAQPRLVSLSCVLVG